MPKRRKKPTEYLKEKGLKPITLHMTPAKLDTWNDRAKTLDLHRKILCEIILDYADANPELILAAKRAYLQKQMPKETQ